MDKVFILGLDGLEHDFVEDWNLSHLKQKQYDAIEVPIDGKMGIPTTPEVWASFLTGRYTHKSFRTIKAPLEPIFGLLTFLRRYMDLSLGLDRRIKEKIPRKFWRGMYVELPDLGRKTFLDLTRSREINAPYYSYDHVPFIIGRNFGDGKISLTETVGSLKALYEKRKMQIFRGAAELREVDVLFSYMHFPDILQHYLFTRPSRIKKLYLDMDSYVSRLKGTIEESVVFIIVSDHGFDFDSGTHSKMGFYSSNVPLDPKPQMITDFFDILVSRK